MRFLGPAEAGFFVVILVVTMLVRWLEAIQVVIAKSWTYGDEPRQRRPLLWALPLVLMLHSGPWALAVFLYLSWYLIGRPENSPGFGWGLTAGALFMGLLISSTFRRRRRLAANAA